MNDKKLENLKEYLKIKKSIKDDKSKEILQELYADIVKETNNNLENGDGYNG